MFSKTNFRISLIGLVFFGLFTNLFADDNIDEHLRENSDVDLLKGSKVTNMPYGYFISEFGKTSLKGFDKIDLSAYKDKKLLVGYGTFDINDDNCRYLDVPSNDTFDTDFDRRITLGNKTFGISRRKMTYSQCLSKVAQYSGFVYTPQNYSQTKTLTKQFGADKDLWVGYTKKDCDSTYLNDEQYQQSYEKFRYPVEVCTDTNRFTYTPADSTEWLRVNQTEEHYCPIQINSSDYLRPIKFCLSWWRVERQWELPEEDQRFLFNGEEYDFSYAQYLLDFPKDVTICSALQDYNATEASQTYEITCNSYDSINESPICIDDITQEVCHVNECQGYIENACDKIDSFTPYKDYDVGYILVDGIETRVKTKENKQISTYTCPVALKNKCIKKEVVEVLPATCPNSQCEELAKCLKDHEKDSKECLDSYYCEKNYGTTDNVVRDINGVATGLKGFCEDGSEVIAQIKFKERIKKTCVDYEMIEKTTESYKTCISSSSSSNKVIDSAITDKDEYEDDESCLRTNNIEEARPNVTTIFDYETKGFFKTAIIKSYIDDTFDTTDTNASIDYATAMAESEIDKISSDDIADIEVSGDDTYEDDKKFCEDTFNDEWLENRYLNLGDDGSGLLGLTKTLNPDRDVMFCQDEIAVKGDSFCELSAGVLPVYFGGSNEVIDNSIGIDYPHIGTRIGDEFLAIPDTSETYKISGNMKIGIDGKHIDTSNKQYFGFSCYDIDKRFISVYSIAKVSGSTDTTIAETLNPGDTKIVLTDASGWHNGTCTYDCHQKSIIWYGYTDSTGYTYPDYTYSQNYKAKIWEEGGVSQRADGKWEITLRQPWDGPTLPVGEKVRNTRAGGTYNYLFSGAITNTDYEYKTFSFGGGIGDGTKFRYATKYIKAMMLPNYRNSDIDNTVVFKNIYFTKDDPKETCLAQRYEYDSTKGVCTTEYFYNYPIIGVSTNLSYCDSLKSNINAERNTHGNVRYEDYDFDSFSISKQDILDKKYCIVGDYLLEKNDNIFKTIEKPAVDEILYTTEDSINKSLCESYSKCVPSGVITEYSNDTENKICQIKVSEEFGEVESTTSMPDYTSLEVNLPENKEGSYMGEINGYSDVFSIQEYTEGDFGYSSNYMSLLPLNNIVKLDGKELSPVIPNTSIDYKIKYDYDVLNHTQKTRNETPTMKKPYFDLFSISGYFSTISTVAGDNVFGDPLLDTAFRIALSPVALLFGERENWGWYELSYKIYQKFDLEQSNRYFPNIYGYDHRELEDGEYIWDRYKYHTGTLKSGDYRSIVDMLTKRKKEKFLLYGFDETVIDALMTSQVEKDAPSYSYPGKSKVLGIERLYYKTNKEVTSAETEIEVVKKVNNIYYGATNTVSIVVPYDGEYELKAYDKAENLLATKIITKSDYITNQTSSNGNVVAKYARVQFSTADNFNVAFGQDGNVTGDSCLASSFTEWGGGVSGAYYEQGVPDIPGKLCNKSLDYYVQKHSATRITVRPINTEITFNIDLKKPLPFPNRVFLVNLENLENRKYECWDEIEPCVVSSNTTNEEQE